MFEGSSDIYFLNESGCSLLGQIDSFFHDGTKSGIPKSEHLVPIPFVLEAM